MAQREEVLIEVEEEAPLTGWPLNVVDAAAERVRQYADDESVEAFYIGRGVDLAGRKDDHEAEHIIPLYKTDSPDNAMDVEEMLIKTFIDDPKNENDAADARGGVSDDYVNYVYVALWFGELEVSE